tara:strand:+ start:577 stop:708 length:132 start_codon:yes stop_codon:yes gene_type:complete
MQSSNVTTMEKIKRKKSDDFSQRKIKGKNKRLLKQKRDQKRGL